MPMNAAGAAGATTGDATRGAALWVKQPQLGCDTCHGLHAEGDTAPNITKSVTGGIGAFTYAQFHQAVREGKNKEGMKLCFAMVAFTTDEASEQDIADLYAYQQAQPPVDAPAANAVYCGTPAAPCPCTGESVK